MVRQSGRFRKEAALLGEKPADTRMCSLIPACDQSHATGLAPMSEVDTSPALAGFSISNLLDVSSIWWWVRGVSSGLIRIKYPGCLPES